jgi:opacity protein-like surface antigen
LYLFSEIWLPLAHASKKSLQTFTYIYLAVLQPARTRPRSCMLIERLCNAPARNAALEFRVGGCPHAHFSKGENVEMIRFAAATIILTGMIGSLGFAQDSTPKVQVFAGYSLFHADPGGLNDMDLDLALRPATAAFGVPTNFNGWNAEGQYNANRWIGIVADFGGRYGSPFAVHSSSGVSGLPQGNGYSFLAGPVISYRTKSRVTPFVHVLFGWDRSSLSGSTITGLQAPVTAAPTTYYDFAVALGAGVDYKITRRFAIRVGQVDFYHTSLNLNKFYDSAFGVGLFQSLAIHQDNLRLSAGAVVRF